MTARIYRAWRTDRFTLLLSESIAAEVESVLSRPEVLEKLHTGPIAARALLVLLRRWAEFVPSTIALRLSRDPGDDKFLECAVDGRADYIVSADADLLTLSAVQGIPILDASGFWKTLEGADR
ncbi:MAG: putative toxin-antitoxin system toxin component, PIN family [Thermoanaerobaculia bacterium]